MGAMSTLEHQTLTMPPKKAAVPEPEPEVEKEEEETPAEPERGTGSFVFADGSRYTGEWEKDSNGVIRRQGEGVLTDGEQRYEGQWSADLMHGKGAFYYSSGAMYEGEWAHNKYHGQGKYDWPDGSFYEGNWKDNMVHGEGCFVDTHGLSWKGRFYNGTGPGLTPNRAV